MTLSNQIIRGESNERLRTIRWKSN